MRRVLLALLAALAPALEAGGLDAKAENLIVADSAEERKQPRELLLRSVEQRLVAHLRVVLSEHLGSLARRLTHELSPVTGGPRQPLRQEDAAAAPQVLGGVRLVCVAVVRLLLAQIHPLPEIDLVLPEMVHRRDRDVAS